MNSLESQPHAHVQSSECSACVEDQFPRIKLYEKKNKLYEKKNKLYKKKQIIHLKILAKKNWLHFHLFFRPS